MTKNQIDYQNVKETQRHNRVVESQTGLTLDEAKRHNQAVESYNLSGLSETQRHNREGEMINWYTAQNLANLQSAQADLARSDIGVRARANEIAAYANEIRQQEANTNERRTQAEVLGLLTSSSTGERNAAVGERNASTNETNAGINLQNFYQKSREVSEKIRHDTATENIDMARTVASIFSLFN